MAYLEAASAGVPSEALAVGLAAAVVSVEQFRLALAVFAGGPHIHARATELAASVLSTTLAADAGLLNRKREA